VYVTVEQQQHNLKYLALYVKILGDGLRAFLLRYQIFKYARASLEICFLQTSQWCSLFSVTVVTSSFAGVLSGYA